MAKNVLGKNAFVKNISMMSVNARSVIIVRVMVSHVRNEISRRMTT